MMNINPNYDYLKFESNMHSSFRMNDYLPNIQYSLDGVTFVDYTPDEHINFENTLYIQWEGALFNNATLGRLELHGENIKVSGRLLHGDASHAYRGLFSGCNGIVDASELILPSETVGEYAYSEMFSGCKQLTLVPELPATTLSEGCYSHMFYGCSSLTTVPELPATTLEPYCYDSMFSFCTSLTTVPNLIDTNVDFAYKEMFYGCTGLEEFLELTDEQYNSYTYSGIFTKCFPEVATFNLRNTRSVDPILQAPSNLLDTEDWLGFINVDSTASTISFNYYEPTLSYSTDGITFTSYTKNTTLNIEVGGSIYFKWTGALNTSMNFDSIVITSGGLLNVSGRLLHGNISYSYCFLFYNNKQIKDASNILLPATTLAEYCYYSMFYGCSSLTSVTIPNSVTSIEYEAFYNCSSLTSITIPNSVTSIGESAFRYCSSLTSVDIPNSVTSIGGSAFSGCSSLTSVTIGNSVTSIGRYAFWSCNSLTSVTIPNSVTTIGNYAFQNCSSLTSVILPNNASISSSAFENTGRVNVDGVYYGKETVNIGNYTFNNVGLIKFYLDGNATTITPSEVSVIDCDESLSGDIVIPSILNYEEINYSVTSIGNNAFYNCSSLTSVTIPNSVTSIGNNAFYNCSSLTSVILPNNANIYSSAFENTGGIKVGGIYYGGKGTVNIGNYTFNNVGLIKFYLDGNVYTPTLTEVSVVDCDVSLSGDIVIPSILNYEEINYSVTSIGNNAFYGCSSLTSVTIPNSVTSIGNNAFYNCSSLTSVTIPNSVTSIGLSTFWGCSSLTSVTIPDSVTTIGSQAFWSCRSLTSVTIPNSVTSINTYAFCSCSSLTSVTCLAETAPSLGSYVFSSTPSTKILIVPVGATGYTTSWAGTTWSAVNYSMVPTDGINYKLNDINTIETFSSNNKSETLTIPSSVTYNNNTYTVNKVSRNSLANDNKVKTLTIESGINKIEASALSGCNNLETVNIPNSVSEIDNHAFWMCENLTTVNLPSTLTKLKPEMFVACENLQTITIPNGITKIPFRMFEGCKNLTTVNLPNTITEIQWSAFKDCKNLTTINIPSGCEVDSTAFEGTNINK